jgi:hypothetical protein
MSDENTNKIAKLKNSYQPTIACVGDSYQPIPKDTATVSKSLVPPKGGTAARVIQLKTVTPGTDKK